MAAKKQPTFPDIIDLNADELQLLLECPNAEPKFIVRGEEKIVERLTKRGLLERDPSNPKRIRATSDGEIAARPLSHTRVKYERDQIEKHWYTYGGFERAFARERALWKRILVECSLGGSRNASIALETDDILKPR